MIYISGIFLMLLIVFFFFSRSYHIELFKNFDKLEKKEHKLNFLYPTCYFLISKFPIRIQTKWKQKYIRTLKDLYIGYDLEQVYLFYLCKKISTLFFLFFLVNLMAFMICISEKKETKILKGTKIERLNYGEGSQDIKLDVKLQKGKEDIKGEIEFQLDERRYTKEELEDLIEKVKEYINTKILGENSSFENILKPLYLVKSYPNSSIQISWDLGTEDLIEANGKLKNENIQKEGKLTCITAHIKYYDIKIDYPIYLRIMPKVISKKELLFLELKKLIAKEEKGSLTEPTFSLPNKMGDYKLSFYEKKSNTVKYIYILGIVMIIVVSIVLEKEIIQKQRKREIQLLIDYPEIVNKFVLLLGAGMTMRGAWEKIVTEYENKIKQEKKKKRYAYEELLMAWYEITNGISEIKAFENFGNRIKLLPYLKFSSLVTQNLKKGSADLLQLLEAEAIQAFEQRKDLTKKMGEEAGTKLLFPMMIMLLIVLMIIMVPAFMSF